ncbi:TetR/AcrR family transcriptional regulator [Frondihabitans cladoniiphilus]|uniref:TetR/AcrR family transcriptional regulator n=1 Tax=Frondihabitans cladoniiphilus TaxID=715785 RepID=A0ABP8W8D0_9MICO
MPNETRDAKRAESSRKILAAAQEEFALLGFEGATIRSIAARAGVHASLVMQHYGSKAALFATAVQLPSDDSNAAADHLADVLDVRLGELPPETRALVRSMLTSPEAAETMRSFLDERIDNLEQSLESSDEDARARAALTVSSILGLTIARHFLRLEAFERIPPETLRAAGAAWLREVATGAAPGPDPDRLDP